MALRVLLADESTTIKKVMQLALQDFAVEVKSVHAGIDVLDVARSFQPDIIFADVLLQKKNGYEVCAAIKNDRELSKIPVVLMWSSFMDLDEASANSCGAEARLEKPFDVETLRKQVLDLVPKTRSQRLAHFLDFSPRLNEELVEDPTAQAQAQPPQPAPMAPPPPVQSQTSQAPAPGQNRNQQGASTPTYAPPQTVASKVAPQAPPPAQTPSGPPPASGLGERLAARAAQAAQVNQTPAAPARKGPPSPDAFLSRATSTMIRPLGPNESYDLADPAGDLAGDLNGDLAADAGPDLVAEQPPQSKNSSWSMASFDDPANFETSDESEDFAPLELSQLAKDDDAPVALEAHADDDAEDEAWARQDLSQFKLDLPPISVGEGPGGFNIDMGEEEFTGSGLETEPMDEAIQAPPQRREPRRAAPPPAISHANEDEDLFGNDLTLEPEQISASHDEIALPLQPIGDDGHKEDFQISPVGSARSTAAPPPGVGQNFGQMSAHQLELVIRAQSREIIEQVVRKIVPDLAATIIREELERLLEDTAVRDTGKNL